MEKTLLIDGKEIQFKSTGGSVLRYRMQYGRDFISDLLKLEKAFDIDSQSLKDSSALDLEVFYNIIWVFAKTANPNIPAPLDWLDSFESFPLIEIIPELMDMITSNLKTLVSTKN